MRALGDILAALLVIALVLLVYGRALWLQARRRGPVAGPPPRGPVVMMGVGLAIGGVVAVFAIIHFFARA